MAILGQLLARGIVKNTPDVATSYTNQITATRPSLSLSIMPSPFGIVFVLFGYFDSIFETISTIDLSSPPLILRICSYAACLGIIGVFIGLISGVLCLARALSYDEEDVFGEVHPDSLAGWLIRAELEIPRYLMQAGLGCDIVGLIVCTSVGALVAWSTSGESLAVKLSVVVGYLLVSLVITTGVGLCWSMKAAGDYKKIRQHDDSQLN